MRRTPEGSAFSLKTRSAAAGKSKAEASVATGEQALDVCAHGFMTRPVSPPARFSAVKLRLKDLAQATSEVT